MDIGKLFEALIQSIIDHGPGMVIAVIILVGLFRLFKDVGLKIADSAHQMASAVEVQTESMKSLGNTFQQYVSRDNTEHREIIILLKVIGEKFDKMEERIEEKR